MEKNLKEIREEKRRSVTKIDEDKERASRKQMVLEFIEEEDYVPMNEKEIATVLRVSKSYSKEFIEVLKELLYEKKVTISKKGKYKKMSVGSKKIGPEIVGTFISNPRGFGFVEIEGQEQDLFIPTPYVNGAMHKDTVIVELLMESRGQRQEAKIISIKERATNHFVGSYQQNNGFGFVVPDSERLTLDIFIPNGSAMGAVDGHKVVAEITNYGENGKNPEGKIIEILGHINDPGVDILSIVKAYDLPTEFGEKVMNRVELIKDEVILGDFEGRMDFRSVQMVTIDGEDAKDLDDAISVRREGENFILGVYIADVTNYVQESSALDKEALKRGTSVYLVDRVIPMLPHKLSNGICSLNQGQDRLSLCCIMTINPLGEVIEENIYEAVINVDRRMSYTVVSKLLEEKEADNQDLFDDHKELIPMFKEMQVLAAILREKRKTRGSIDFDFPETKVILDKDGKPIEIKPYDRNIASKIIEDFMLIANETVAEHFNKLEVPFLYRTHDKPDEEKIQALATFINNFGYSLKLTNKEVHPKELQKLLTRVEGSPEEALISRLTLRSMKQARYSTESTGHFGLACTYYSHFTSPIRRYPDLQIHRIIKENLRGRFSEERIEHYNGILSEVAKHTSDRERVAQEAERETIKMKQVEFMESRIGEEFEGVISGITTWGMYVELSNTVEGMVHVSNIPGDYFNYSEETYEMVGEKTGRTYKLGEKIKVIVKDTDKTARRIDFSILE